MLNHHYDSDKGGMFILKIFILFSSIPIYVHIEVTRKIWIHHQKNFCAIGLSSNAFVQWKIAVRLFGAAAAIGVHFLVNICTSEWIFSLHWPWLTIPQCLNLKKSIVVIIYQYFRTYISTLFLWCPTTRMRWRLS